MTPTLARLYTLLHRGTPGDRGHYRRVCEGAATVLELGVGAGRLAIDLAERGAEVTGVDLEPGMLALARAASSAVTWIEGDLCEVDLGARFDRVIIPYNTLCALLTPEALRRALANAARHLAPEGRLAFDIYRGDPSGEVDETEELIVELEQEGRTWAVYEQAIAHADPSRADTRYRFRSGDEELAQVIEQRLISDAEIAEALHAAGLHPVALAGGFSGEPLDDEAPHLVATAALEG